MDAPGDVRVPHDIDWNSLDKKKFYFLNACFYVVARVIQYPPMLIKTRLQVQQIKSISPGSQVNVPSPQYRGAFDAFTKIAKREGYRGLYKGFLTTSVGSLPTQFVYLTTFEFARAHIPYQKSSSYISTFLAGGISSLASTAFSVPLDVISQRLMVQDGNINQYQYKGGLNALSTILKTEGIRGLYRGWVATLCTYAPYSAAWWGSYYFYKNTFYSFAYNFFGSAKPTPAQEWSSDTAVSALSGVCAAFTGVILTNPLDVAKTRLQVLKSEQNKNIYSVIRDLWREEGFKSMTRGIQARMTTAALMSVIMSTGYESVKKLSYSSQ